MLYIIWSLLRKQTKGKYTRDGEKQIKVIFKGVLIGIKQTSEGKPKRPRKAMFMKKKASKLQH